MNIYEIDKNLKERVAFGINDIKYYDTETEPFKFYGIHREGDSFCRMPAALAEKVSDNIKSLNRKTAGGRLRFKTDSAYVALYVVVTEEFKMPRMALCGTSGFDIYESTESGQRYMGTYIPPAEYDTEYDGIVHFNGKKMRDLIINFPLFAGVKKLYVGIEKGASLASGDEYRYKEPIVYYGSSITQGGCVSRPGCTYQSIISSKLDVDYINFGFAGNAMGEVSIADYISQLKMSVFVYAYDHNAPSAEYLQNTHKPFFDVIRRRNPKLPVIILPRPKFYLCDDEKIREDIIQNTYAAAKADGDKNVYFISGRELMNLVKDNGTVDNVHPTDSGFFSIAKALEPIVSEILSKQNRKETNMI